MKELSIEQKAKAYDEALERARKINNGEGVVAPPDWTTCEVIFPELKESEGNEDERIRKEIVSAINIYCSEYSRGTKVRNDMLDWLERQDEHEKGLLQELDDKLNNTLENETPESLKKFLDEQKPANKVEPKFHKGDWIVISTSNGRKIVHIVSIEYFPSGQPRYITSEGKWLGNGIKAHLWNITQDAKDGDVIYSRHNTESFEWIGILKSLDKENKRVFFYGFWNNMAKTFSVCRNEAYVLYDDFSPATKEQRDALEKAMVDSGYTFDFEKKELKKIVNEEQIKKNLQDNNFRRMFEQKPVDKYKEWYDFIRWFVKQRTDDYTLIPSDDDIHRWGDNILNHARKVLEQNTAEWNEEDERMYRGLHNLIYSTPYCDSRKELSDWLKFLKDRYNWKPSDEQMDVLLSEVTAWTKGCHKQIVLESLYNDLKKLKE